MKILIAKFQLESNENVGINTDLEDTALSFGEQALQHMQLGNVFSEKDVDLIPVLCCDGACSGVMKKNAFIYLENKILDSIRNNLHNLDGIYYHLHGASFVEEIGSGEQHLLRETRKIVGPYFPIAVSCDPHGNLTKEYVENCTLIRSYRNSPHTDIAQTVQFVCQHLLQIIRTRKNITPVYIKLPLILGGEQSVSQDEPIKSFNLYMDNLEKDERILSVSWHVGYLRHDCPEAGCGIVVVPTDNKYRDYAAKICKIAATEIFSRRKDFHYTGLTALPEEAVKLAINFDDKPVFITDSGDNVTSGALGANTFILNQILSIPNLKKKVLFAAINDPKLCNYLYQQNTGQELEIELGINTNQLTNKQPMKVKIISKGRQEGTKMYGEHGDYGPIVTVSLLNKPIDIAITNNNHSFVEIHQIAACGVDYKNYDIIVVKQGYIHPEEKKISKLCIMSLTNGATPQDTKLIDFKLIMRPMYPLDDI